MLTIGEYKRLADENLAWQAFDCYRLTRQATKHAL